ncbi:hypothetical protein [Segatella bryantii]|nr:hypothetical protein [Segatella bryantii]UKK82497.1 hypothetical protein L6474_11385 [Segatella bryantii]
MVRISNYLKGLTLVSMMSVATMTLQSCSDSDNFTAVDNADPTLLLSQSTILTEPGRAFTIEGIAKDADGLKSIRLVNDDLYLDKTIDFLTYYPDSLLHEYHLNYGYNGDKTWTGTESFPIQITVEDVMGHTFTTTATVSTAGDFSAPTFTTAPSPNLTVLLQNPKLTLNTTVADNKELGYIKISIPAVHVNDSIALTGTSYTLQKAYELPATEAEYNMTITIGDKGGNTTSTQSVVKVSELPDFSRMYLADVDDVADLSSDLYGVPMLIEHTGAYQYRAHYYNKAAGTKIRFIPQKTDFQPICFSVDPNTGLLTSDPSAGDPIELQETGYYEFTLNTVTGEWDMKKWTPTTAAMTLDGTTTVNFKDDSGDQPAQICLAGEGLPGTANWTTNQNNGAFILYQDKTNPYRLYREMKLTAGTTLSFTISQTHWWGWWPQPYWRFDGSDENEANVLNGGDNMKSVTVKTDGTYLFEFDYALLRSRITLVK